MTSKTVDCSRLHPKSTVQMSGFPTTIQHDDRYANQRVRLIDLHKASRNTRESTTGRSWRTTASRAWCRRSRGRRNRSWSVRAGMEGKYNEKRTVDFGPVSRDRVSGRSKSGARDGQKGCAQEGTVAARSGAVEWHLPETYCHGRRFSGRQIRLQASASATHLRRTTAARRRDDVILPQPCELKKPSRRSAPQI